MQVVSFITKPSSANSYVHGLTNGPGSIDDTEFKALTLLWLPGIYEL